MNKAKQASIEIISIFPFIERIKLILTIFYQIAVMRLSGYNRIFYKITK
jgi:hypothetical protein